MRELRAHPTQSWLRRSREEFSVLRESRMARVEVLWEFRGLLCIEHLEMTAFELHSWRSTQSDGGVEWQQELQEQ